MASAGIGDSLEGVHAVAAALDAGRVTSLTVEAHRVGKPPVARLVATARALGVPVSTTDDVRHLAATSAPQGVVASAIPIATRWVRDLVDGPEVPAVLVLDRVEDPRNVGAAARSAAAAGLTGLVVAQRRAAPLGAVAFKAAAGGLEHIPVAVVGSIADAVAELHRLGLWTIGLDTGGDQALFGLDLLAGPVALVLGSEGKGLSRLVSERVDVIASIPLADHTESLNVSAAATLAAFEVARSRGR